MFSIYALKDPRTDEIRYVGKTSVSLTKRFSRHLSEHKKTHKCHWVQSLREQGIKPTLVLLEECETETEANDAERTWIAVLPRFGVSLTNITEGGEGYSGPHSEEHERNRYTALMKTFSDPDYVSPHKGVPLSDEHRAKVSEAKKKTWKDPTYRERTLEHFRLYAFKGGSSPKLTASKIGRKQSAETVAKRAAKLKGRKQSPEEIARRKAFWTPEKREQAGRCSILGWETRRKS
jgi:hypothetical protein